MVQNKENNSPHTKGEEREFPNSILHYILHHIDPYGLILSSKACQNGKLKDHTPWASTSLYGPFVKLEKGALSPWPAQPGSGFPAQ